MADAQFFTAGAAGLIAYAVSLAELKWLRQKRDEPKMSGLHAGLPTPADMPPLPEPEFGVTTVFGQKILRSDAELFLKKNSSAMLSIENERLRAALAMSDLPCVYCTLPADRMNECVSGFPGCARGDDMMGCPELGARMQRDQLIEALSPSADTKYAYGNEVKMPVTFRNEDGREIVELIPVSWTAVKEIMKLIRARAGCD